MRVGRVMERGRGGKERLGTQDERERWEKILNASVQKDFKGEALQVGAKLCFAPAYPTNFVAGFCASPSTKSNRTKCI